MFSNRIVELRKKHNLTQIEFAKIFNVASGTIGMWETGKRTPDHDMLRKIADYFEVSIDYLLGRTDVPQMATKKALPSEDFDIRDPSVDIAAHTDDGSVGGFSDEQLEQLEALIKKHLNAKTEKEDKI